jgi:predicted acyltransferase
MWRNTRSSGSEKQGLLLSSPLIDGEHAESSYDAEFYKSSINAQNSSSPFETFGADVADKPSLSHGDNDSGGGNRLQSLDAVRGFAMLIMILVNNGPSSPPDWWGHALWDGMGLADWVMPLFLAISGTSTSLSFAKLFDKQEPRFKILLKVIERSIKLFALGLFVQGFRSIFLWPYCDLDLIRIMGVLQRIAICYFISATLFLFSPKIVRTPKEEISNPVRSYPYGAIGGMYDNEIDEKLSLGTHLLQFFEKVILKYLILWIFGLLFAGAYAGIIFGVYVPSYRLGVKCDTRGSLEERCNAPDYLDYLTIGSNHMFTPYHEPEGFTSTISALGSSFFGLFLGVILYEFKSHKTRLIQWSISSTLVVCVGVLTWYLGIPVNKRIYSLSYCLITAGGMGLLLCILYAIMDVFHNKYINYLFLPLVYFGMNAILVYVGDFTLRRVLGFFYYQSLQDNLSDWFRRLFFEADWPDYVAQHMYALFKVLFWMIVAFILFEKKIFWKV